MSDRKLVSVRELGQFYELDIDVLIEFGEVGLYTPLIEQQEWFLDSDELPELESLIRLYQGFSIPAEGLDVIRHLRSQITELRDLVRRQEQRLKHLHLQIYDNDQIVEVYPI